MNPAIFILGLEKDELQRCNGLERSLYYGVGLFFWIFIGLIVFAGAVNFYYINDHWISILIGVTLFPSLFGILFWMLLLSIRRTPRFFDRKWLARVFPDWATLIRTLILSLFVLMIALPVSGVLQYKMVSRLVEQRQVGTQSVSADNGIGTAFSTNDIELKRSISGRTHYPVAVYTALMTTGTTKFVIVCVSLVVFLPVILLTIIKGGRQFKYQDVQDSRMERQAIDDYGQTKLLRDEVFVRFNSRSVAPYCSEYKDYPVNAILNSSVISAQEDDEKLRELIFRQ